MSGDFPPSWVTSDSSRVRHSSPANGQRATKRHLRGCLSIGGAEPGIVDHGSSGTTEADAASSPWCTDERRRPRCRGPVATTRSCPVHDVDPVGNTEDAGQVARDHEDRGPVRRAKLSQQFEDTLLGKQSEPSGRLVGHDRRLYEALVAFALAGAPWWLQERRQPVVVVGTYQVGAGAARFLNGFARENAPAPFGLTQPQLWSVVLAAAGLLLRCGHAAEVDTSPCRGAAVMTPPHPDRMPDRNTLWGYLVLQISPPERTPQPRFRLRSWPSPFGSARRLEAPPSGGRYAR